MPSSERAGSQHALLEPARLALERRHSRRACDLVDMAINARPPPDVAAGLLLLRARAELALGLSRAAAESARRAGSLSERSSAEACGLGATAASALGRWADAAAGFAEAIALEPCAAAWQAGRATALLELGDAEGAGAHARCATELEPTNVDALLVRGRLALREGCPHQAAECLRLAAASAPERADVHATLGVALGASGEISAGLREYEWRQKLQGWNPRRFDIPAWQEEQLGDKRLLVWTEQGLGDCLQFARFAKLARARGARVLFHGEPRLVRLFRSCTGFDELHSAHAPRPPADFHASLVSLPALLGGPSGGFGQLVPYLHAEPRLVEAWRARLDGSAPRAARVALVWQGNPAFCDDEQRSLALARLVPLVLRHSSSVDFVSLQKGFGQDQLHFLPPGANVLDLGAELDGGGDAFVDTAAALASIGLVITTDTAVAHLAGALGRETWLLLSRVPDWRWGVAGATSPWYPSLRLFRQPQAGDWTSVLTEVERSLDLWLAERPS